MPTSSYIFKLSRGLHYVQIKNHSKLTSKTQKSINIEKNPSLNPQVPPVTILCYSHISQKHISKELLELICYLFYIYLLTFHSFFNLFLVDFLPITPPKQISPDHQWPIPLNQWSFFRPHLYFSSNMWQIDNFCIETYSSHSFSLFLSILFF